MGRVNLLDRFKADLELRGHAKSTIEGELLRAKHYLAWTKERGLEPNQATKDDLKSYLAFQRAQGRKAATLQKVFSTLITFYDWLEDENLSSANPARAVRKKYLQSYKKDSEERQIISIEDAARMVAATIDTRDRAILLMLLKTGIRRGELISLDVADVNIQEMRIKLKPTAKRTNRIVFFDHETAEALKRWLSARARRAGTDTALFIGEQKTRLNRGGVRRVVMKAAERVGLHTHGAPLEKRFGAHCCRHWFTTHLRRAGMPREFIQELRGDVRREAIDIYDHIDKEELRRSYLAHIPQLGV
jgi:integrase/recombinase XerD